MRTSHRILNQKGEDPIQPQIAVQITLASRRVLPRVRYLATFGKGFDGVVCSRSCCVFV